MNKRKVSAGIVLILLLTSVLSSVFIIKPVRAERTLGVKAGDWIKYEYITVVASGGHPWVRLDVRDVEKTTVTVLWTTGVPSGAFVPSDMPVGGMTVSWDITTGNSPYSYFIIHANPKVGDLVNIMSGITIQIQGEETRTYAGVSRGVVYASYSSFGLQNKYYWDKQTGVLLEYSSDIGGVQLTMKAVETNLWYGGFAGHPLWIVVIVVLIVAIVVIAILLREKKFFMKE